MGHFRLKRLGAPAIITANTVSGVVGGTLTNIPGTYTGNPTVTRQWQKKIGSAYANIGATGTTLASVYATHGNNIRCLETATYSNGSVSQSATAQYLGQVATNCKVLTNIDVSDTALMSRSPHYSTDSITSLQLVFANWYWDDFPTKTELGSGGNMTAAASIEYPVGTFTQVLFGGLTTSAAVASGNNLISDSVAVSIPANTQFWVRCYMTYAAGIIYQSGATFASVGTYDPTNNTVLNGSSGGHAMTYTAPTNQTMGGTVTATVAGNNGPSYVPLAIIANTRVPSVALLGDSICDSRYDKYDADNTIGFGRYLAHLTTKVGFIQLSGEGETVANQKANFVKRGAMVQYCSHVWQQGGVNDLTAAVGNATAATLEANLTGAGGLLTVYAPNTPCYATTIIPPTTSTDSWATTANQTVDGNSAQRVIFNNDMRAVPAPYAGCIEFADILESARDSGKRKVTGVANAYQPDSVHPTTTAHILARDAPIITASTFVR